MSDSHRWTQNPGAKLQSFAPIQVRGTLAVNRDRCGVVQIAFHGPADGIEWRTLWGGFKPGVRLCSGRTVQQAELGRQCETHRPPAA